MLSGNGSYRGVAAEGTAHRARMISAQGSQSFKRNRQNKKSFIFQIKALRVSSQNKIKPQRYLIRMMTEGVWAMAPTRLQTQITHRKMRKDCWHPGIGHFPGTAVALSLSLDIQEQPVRFCQQKERDVCTTTSHSSCRNTHATPAPHVWIKILSRNEQCVFVLGALKN